MEFYDRGGRYMSLAHNGASQLSDSNNGETTGMFPHGGLSPLGRQVIAEMNRLGMLVDLSHVSPEAMHDALAMSRAPVIFSHSSARALTNHPAARERTGDDVTSGVVAEQGILYPAEQFDSHFRAALEQIVVAAAEHVVAARRDRDPSAVIACADLDHDRPVAVRFQRTTPLWAWTMLRLVGSAATAGVSGGCLDHRKQAKARASRGGCFGGVSGLLGALAFHQFVTYSLVLRFVARRDPHAEPHGHHRNQHRHDTKRRYCSTFQFAR